MNPNRALFFSHSLMLVVCLLVCLLLSSVPPLARAQTAVPAASEAAATTPATAPVTSLDSRVQALKAEALRLSRDLQLLEEELLFPPGTQVAVFVSLELGPDTAFDLESLQVKLNDKVIAQVTYTAPELQALRRGAVQRLFVGNLRTGSHSIEATATGREGAGRPAYKRSTSAKFDKGTAPRYIELRLKEAAKKDASDKQQPELEVKVWQ